VAGFIVFVSYFAAWAPGISQRISGSDGIISSGLLHFSANWPLSVECSSQLHPKVDCLAIIESVEK
jgi:hypothetical protein